MRIRFTSPPALLVVLIAWSSASQALNPLWFLDHSPARDMTRQDLEIMTRTLDSVLADPAQSETRSWTNPETGSSGKVRALKRFEHDGLSCRRIALSNQAKGNTQKSVFDLCEIDGEWKVLGMPE